MALDGTPRRTVEPDDTRRLAARLADVEKSLEALGKNASLRNASVSGGDGLTVKDASDNIRLRVSPADGAIIAYNSSGAEVARYGQLAHVDVGQFGIEALTATGWSHVGSGGTTWAAIDSKPTTFPPSAHTHPGGDVTSAVSLALEAEGSGYAWNNNVGGTTWYAVYVGNNGGYKFGRNTSSIRYKENVRDFAGDVSDLMALRPVLFDRKPQLAEAPTWTDPDGVVWPAEGPRYLEPGRKDEYGFIAEEMLEVWPEIIQWFDHEDGNGPVVDGIRYEMIGARLVPVLQDLLIQTRASARRVREVESRVKGLEDAAAITKAQLADQAKLIQDLTIRIEGMT